MKKRLLLSLGLLLIALGMFSSYRALAQPDAPAPSAHAPDAEPGAKSKGHAKAAPQKIRVGILLINLGKLDLGAGTFSAEFYAAFTCEDKTHDCNPDFDILDGKITSKEVVDEDSGTKTFRVKAELQADIDLAEFPFDHQELSIDLIDRTGEALLDVDKKESGVDQDVKLAGWLIDGFEVKARTHKYVEVNEELHIVSLDVTVSRARFPAFMKQFFPVLIIMLISLFGLFIAPKQIANRIALSTAGLLSAVMFHLSSTSALPPISYLTRVDRVLFTTYGLLLICATSAVLLARFDDLKQDKATAALHKYSMRIVPVIVVVAYALVFLRVF
ncbi:MAG: hypothetical protein WCI05_00750 [Myxococcales bacterium]